MDKILVIVPEHSNRERLMLLDEHLKSVLPSGIADRRTFYYACGGIVELKQLLMSVQYSHVVIGFPSIHNDFLCIHTVRSLCFRSMVIMFCPELSFTEWRLKNEGCINNEIRHWEEAGRLLEVNACRLADRIIVKSGDERGLLLSFIKDAHISDIESAGAKYAATEGKRPCKASIIVLTFNQLVDTQQCVESLLRYTAYGNYEIIFVDNGSTDATREYLQGLQAKHGNITVILNDKNLGFAKANNQGMRVATGDYILLLNNDVVLAEGWLERMICCLESDPSIGVVGPVTNHAVGQQVVDMPGRHDEPGIRKFAYIQAMRNAGVWFETHRIIGFCMLVRKRVIEQIGMLDERFGPGGFEDYDFCLRIHQAGYRIVIASDVFVYHKGGQGYHRNNLDYDKLRRQNVRIFIDKWCERALEALEIMPNGM